MPPSVESVLPGRSYASEVRIGLPEIGRFEDHDGYDGVFLDVPGTGEAVAAVVERLRAEPVEPANPYWAEHGITVEDPDGFRVALVPRGWAS